MHEEPFRSGQMQPLYALIVLSTLSLKIGLSSPKHFLLFFLSLFLYILFLPLSFIFSVDLFHFNSNTLFSFHVLFFHRVRSLTRLSFPSLYFFCYFSRAHVDRPGYSSMSVIFVAGFSSLSVHRVPSRVR